MHILYQFNEKYAPFAGVSMTSLFENNKTAESICVYILGENLSAKSLERLNTLAESYGPGRKMIFVDSSSLIETMKQLNMPTYRGSYAANMRLFVEYLFDAEISALPDRLLYLDADTIVCGNLEGLFIENNELETEAESEAKSGDLAPLKIKTLGMVYDTLGCFHKYGIGLTEEDGYYNSGVILYDVKKWIDGKYTEKIIEHVKNVRAQYPSPDQDLLNVVLRGEITPLPIRYNYQPHLKDYSYRTYMKCFKPYPFCGEEEVAKAGAVILHAFRYLGEFPWHKGNLHPFTEQFDKYLALSPWKDYEKEKSGAGAVMAIEKMLYHILPGFVFLRLFKIMHGRFYKRADRLSKESRISSRM